MKKVITALTTVFLLAVSHVIPVSAADRVQIASMIDWSGVTLNRTNTTISQSITLTSVPSFVDAETHFSINIGNGENILSPNLYLSNRNTAVFGVFDTPEDTTFEANNPNTECNNSAPNLFSNYSRFQASCTTNVSVVAGETYTFTLVRKGELSAVALAANLKIESSGQIIDLGTINFNASTETINRSSFLTAYNQTSIYATNLQCDTKIDLGVIYSPLSLNSKALKSQKTRLGTPNCSNFLPVSTSDGSYSINFGSIKSTNNVDFTCPIAEDVTSGDAQPKVTGFLFTGTNQRYVRFNDGTKTPVTTAANLIGCYGDLSGIARQKDIGWQYGVISRDSQGFYWKNGAGVRWGLTLDSSGLALTTDTKNPYYSSGNKFNLEGAVAPVANSRSARSKLSWSRPESLLPGLSEVRVKGYFDNNTAYFSNTVEKTLITTTPSNRLPVWSDTTAMGVNASIWWGGYFIPDETGTWDFQITSDDASFMWIGKDAVTRYAMGPATAFISIPDSHPPLTSSNSIYLEKNKIYPLRIQYGNYAGPAGTFKFEVKAPSFKGKWDTNLEGLIWQTDYSDRQDCTNYGISYTLSARMGFGVTDVPDCINNPIKYELNSTSNVIDLVNAKLAYSQYFRMLVSKIQIQENGEKLRYILNYNSDQKLNFSAYTNSNKQLVEATVNAGDSSLVFDLNKSDLQANSNIMWSFYLDVNRRVLISHDSKTLISTVSEFNSKSFDWANLVSYGTNTNNSGSTSNAVNNKPPKPSFKGFNITGNTLNLNLNIGSGTNKPDNVFLIAPNLGIKVASSGNIGNGVATWAIPLSAAVLGNQTELNFFTEKNGINSDTLSTTINLPDSKTNKSVPLVAKNAKYVIGALLVNVTAQTQTKVGANAVGGYLVSTALGITPSNPIVGRISKGLISFGIPVSPALAGRSISTQIYLTNEIGDSKPLNLVIKFPGVSAQTLPNKKIDSVICKKGTQARTFVGKQCPPGWK